MDKPKEQIKREKDRGARARKELAEDKEMYRQEVLLRNAIITEQRRQAAQMKEELQGGHPPWRDLLRSRLALLIAS